MRLKLDLLIETGDGQQVVKLKLDEVTQDFFNPCDLTAAETHAERLMEAKFIGVVRAMLRAHIHKVRSEASRGRVDRPYADWHPPDPDVQASTDRLDAIFHDAFIR